MKNEEQFRKWQRQAIKEELKKEELKRESYWSRAVAVGDEQWLQQFVSENKLKRHEILKQNETNYLQGIGRW
jgi:hypothetical protein